jgi:NitT/TauT family transport system substrate-binding protein
MARLKEHVAALIAIATAAFLFVPAPVRADTTVTVASASTGLQYMVQKLAEQRGFFAAEGITLKVVDFNGGGPAIQAVAGGGADYCICTGDHVIWLRQNNIEARILVAVSEFNTYGLVARGDSTFTDIPSLKGQRVGLTSPGSLTDNIMRYTIKQAGLDADKDFTLLGIGAATAMIPAIDTGAIAAGMVVTPDFQGLMRTPGKYRVVKDFTQTRYITGGTVVMQSWLQKHPDTARGIVRAYLRALDAVRTDPDDVRAYLKQAYPRFDDAFIGELMQVADRLLSKDGRLHEETWQATNDILKSFTPDLKPVPFKDAVAFEYFPAATAAK